MLKLVISSFTAFIAFLILHWAHFHYFIPQGRVNAVLGAALIGLALFSAIYFYLPSEERLAKILEKRFGNSLKILPFLTGAMLYSLLFIGYLEFYFTADRSITFRMLRITDERPSRTVTASEMLSLYDTKSIILRRLDDLEYGGYLQKNGEDYSLTPKGHLTLGVYRFTIDFLHMRSF